MNQCVNRYSATNTDTQLIDLVGRIMLTHTLAPRHAVVALEIDYQAAVAVIATGHLPCPLDVAGRERLPLFVNVLLQLETRFRHDSATTRRAIEQPRGIFAGQSIADMLGGTLDDMRAMRRAVDATTATSEKSYRTGH